jgi:hypothetical protein
MKVKIYQDPITKLDFEGMATIKTTDSVDDELNIASGMVEFDSEPGVQYWRKWTTTND